MRVAAAILTILACVPIARAQGSGYPRALPGYTFEFPRDHGAHTPFRTEWWYFTGNVEAAGGREFGYELTIFRNRLAPEGDPGLPASTLAAGECFIGHFAISDASNERHNHWERTGRAGLGNAGASTETLDVRLHSWSVRLEEGGAIRVVASEPGGAIDLTMTPEKPPVIHGRDGAHPKTGRPGQASHYYSFTRLATRGSIELSGKRLEVEGLSWMDHEFSSDALGDEEVGWDWLALQLDTGEELMLYRIRRRDGTHDPNASGSFVREDGAREELPGDAFEFVPTGTWRSGKTGIDYPMGWKVTAHGGATSLEIDPLFPAQEMTTQRTTGTNYWEGAVRARGTVRGRATTGKGYVELVGYGAPFTQLGSQQGRVSR